MSCWEMFCSYLLGPFDSWYILVSLFPHLVSVLTIRPFNIRICSLSLDIKKIEIKSSLRYSLERVTMTKNSHTLLIGVQICLATKDMLGSALHQDGICSASRTSYTTLGNIYKWCFILPQRHLFKHLYICSNPHNQKLDIIQTPINRRLDKENVVLLHNKILLSHFKK